jgi:hypothetical protein
MKQTIQSKEALKFIFEGGLPKAMVMDVRTKFEKSKDRKALKKHCKKGLGLSELAQIIQSDRQSDYRLSERQVWQDLKSLSREIEICFTINK